MPVRDPHDLLALVDEALGATVVPIPSSRSHIIHLPSGTILSRTMRRVNSYGLAIASYERLGLPVPQAWREKALAFAQDQEDN
ncbi:MAG: hypothetical protein WCV84_05680 [Patescibacteria group bacterium]